MWTIRRDNLWRYCVSSGLRSTLSFDLLPSCILFKQSSLIFALIACLISFFVTSVAMTLGRPRDKQSALDSVARPLILCIVSCISAFLVMLLTGFAIILLTKINFLWAILHFIGGIPVSNSSITFGTLLASLRIRQMNPSLKSLSSFMWLSSIEIHDSQLYSDSIWASYRLRAVFAPPRQDIPGVSTNLRIYSVLRISLLILALIVTVILCMHPFSCIRSPEILFLFIVLNLNSSHLQGIFFKSF